MRVRLSVDARRSLCYASTDAKDSSDHVCSRAGNVGDITTVACCVVHSLERAEPRSLQEQLLREHDLLRGVGEEHGLGLATLSTKWRGQTADARYRCSYAQQFAPAIRSRANCLRDHSGPRAFAASSRGELHSSHLIQRR